MSEKGEGGDSGSARISSTACFPESGPHKVGQRGRRLRIIIIICQTEGTPLGTGIKYV